MIPDAILEWIIPIYGLAWFGCLMCSWNDWAYCAWVLLTVIPFLIDW
jgi:hypothetical protein